jgi:hypothetical protein
MSVKGITRNREDIDSSEPDSIDLKNRVWHKIKLEACG